MNKWIVSNMGIALLIVAVEACAQQPAAAPESAPGKVVARVGDDVITESQLEDLARSSLVGLRQQIYEAELNALNQEIFNRLAAQAAVAEGLSTGEYLKKNVDDKAAAPTDAQIQQVLTQYRSRLAPDDDQARQQVVDYLTQQAKLVQQEALRKSLFAKANVQILLEPPRVMPTIGEGTPTKGPADAPLVIVEYTDYQCPFCSRVQPTLEQIAERYDGLVLQVFKNLPLPNHPQARAAALAALCAGDQGKYWEYHDWLFANQRTMNPDTMKAEAAELGLDTELFDTCFGQQAHAQQIAEDMAEARSFGINGTPGFVINGRVLSGAQPLEAFEALLDQELEMKGIPVPEKPAPATPEKSESEEEATSESGTTSD